MNPLENQRREAVRLVANDKVERQVKAVLDAFEREHLHVHVGWDTDDILNEIELAELLRSALR